ncbi:hypothetical protein M2263_001195 [Providencia alcalifaciens]|nr:hypothetical protein [Providencia alcalifaciens]
MSDKKEIAALSIKISVDSTDLDKLEAQLKRIAGLMINAGLKEPASGGFVSDSFGIFNPKGCLEPVFTISSGVTFINEAYIENATLEKVVLQAAEKGAREGAEQARAEITTGVNHNHEQQSAIAILESSAVTARLSEAISCEDSEFEKFKQQVESEFSQLQSQIASIQCASAASEQSTAQHISGLQRQITQLTNELEEARLKGSVNAISIISIKQTMEQQEKSLAESIMKTIVSDLGRGGNLSRTL